MAAIGTHIEPPTEEDSECIWLDKIILPDGKVEKKYSFLLDNFVYDEIHILVHKYELPGTMDDYDLQMVNRDGKTATLHRREAIENYDEDLKNSHAVKLVARLRYQYKAKIAVDNSGEEAVEPNNDTIFVNKIFLPEGKVVTNRDLSWDNTIKYETLLLGQTYQLPLGVQDYEMQLDNGECTLILEREKVVEDYIDHMLDKEFTITLVESKDLPPPQVKNPRVQTDQDSDDWESYLLTELHIPNGEVLEKRHWALWINAVEDEIYTLIYRHKLPGTTDDYELHMIHGNKTTVMEPKCVVEGYEKGLRKKDCMVKMVPKSTFESLISCAEHEDESASSCTVDDKKGMNSDFIIVSKVTLPNLSTIIDYALGWNNTVNQEIESLIKDNGLKGRPMDFELELSGTGEKICLDKHKVVSFYHTQLSMEGSSLSLVEADSCLSTDVDESQPTFDALNIFLTVFLPDGTKKLSYPLFHLNTVREEIETLILKGLLTGEPEDYNMLHIRGENTCILDMKEEIEIYARQLRERGIIKVLRKSDVTP